MVVHAHRYVGSGGDYDIRTAAPPCNRWEGLLAQRLAEWQVCYPDVWVRRVVVPGRAASNLVIRSESVQLVVVGSYGRVGFAGMLLGSVSSAAVHAARMPVIVARQS
jgi:nucleotide-binding universal stress UspA family protein